MSRRSKELLREAVEAQLRHREAGTLDLEKQIGHIQMLANAYLDGPHATFCPNKPGWWLTWQVGEVSNSVGPLPAQWFLFDNNAIATVEWDPSVVFFGPFEEHPYAVGICRTETWPKCPRTLDPGWKEDD